MCLKCFPIFSCTPQYHCLFCSHFRNGSILEEEHVDHSRRFEYNSGVHNPFKNCLVGYIVLHKNIDALKKRSKKQFYYRIKKKTKLGFVLRFFIFYFSNNQFS